MIYIGLGLLGLEAAGLRRKGYYNGDQLCVVSQHEEFVRLLGFPVEVGVIIFLLQQLLAICMNFEVNGA